MMWKCRGSGTKIKGMTRCAEHVYHGVQRNKPKNPGSFMRLERDGEVYESTGVEITMRKRKGGNTLEDREPVHSFREEIVSESYRHFRSNFFALSYREYGCGIELDVS